MSPSAHRQCNTGLRPSGFTLIELMITVAVVAVLAAIAYPSYTDYVRRGRIAEATAELSAVRVRLEQYYQDNRNYASTAATCGVPMPSGESFTYGCAWGAGATNQSFIVTATGQAAAGMTGYVFTIDSDNVQRTTGYPGAAGLPAACWLKRKGDAC